MFPGDADRSFVKLESEEYIAKFRPTSGLRIVWSLEYSFLACGAALQTRYRAPRGEATQTVQDPLRDNASHKYYRDSTTGTFGSL